MIFQNKAKSQFWKPISTFYKDSKITQLKKLSTRWSYFAAISHSLGDKIDFGDIWNFAHYPKVIFYINPNKSELPETLELRGVVEADTELYPAIMPAVIDVFKFWAIVS